jgi:DNA-binding LacI/PurR family transcriptional regulator
MYIPIVVLDFDGVIHSYKSGWKGAAVIPDPPVEGIKEAIEALMERGYRVVIVSARSATTEGQTAIRDWLKKYNIPVVEIMAEKPPALVYADDRAICFDGDAATLYEKIERFKPWYKKEV